MRGLSSRLAVFALALVIGAAGARSLGSTSPAGTASCSPGPLAGHAAPAAHFATIVLGPRTTPVGGWKRTETRGSGPLDEVGPRPCGGHLVAAAQHPRGKTDASLPHRLPSRRAGGLLGLATSSPANAPPGS